MHQHRSDAVTLAVPADWPRPIATLAVAGMFLFSVAFTGLQAQNVSAQSASTPETTTEQQTGTVLSVADVVEKANAAVVTVYTFVDETSDSGFESRGPRLPGEDSTMTDDATSDEPSPLGAGSGWIYSAEGFVITNAHVVSGADSFVVQYSDGTQVEAKLIGADTLQDVAVLQLVLEDGEQVPGVATVGDSAAMRAGDVVVAMGSPLGEFTNSVSQGNIGGLDRELDTGDGLALSNLIQHDAEISSGNSGGPLLNMDGEVIGMNVARIDTASVGGGSTVSGLNFAIDGNTVASIADTIIETGESVAYPYIGLSTQQTEEGLMIVEVDPTGPAASAGFQPGDMLIGVDDDLVDESTSFLSLLMRHQPGDEVTIVVERAGTEQSIGVTLGDRPVG